MRPLARAAGASDGETSAASSRSSRRGPRPPPVLLLPQQTPPPPRRSDPARRHRGLTPRVGLRQRALDLRRSSGRVR